MKSSARIYSNEKIAQVIETIKGAIDAEKAEAKISTSAQHKVGDIPRWNLPPLLTCGGNCGECKHRCYVLRDYIGPRKGSVSKSHARNYNAITEDLEQVEAYLVKWLQKHRPAFFRIHASGDFAVPHFGYRYAGMWYRVAKACPDTKFLAFTKCYDIVRKVPFCELDNFSLVLSEWTDALEAPADLKEIYPTSRAIENVEDKRPSELLCPGGCETCGMCWALKDIGHNVAFEIH